MLSSSLSSTSTPSPIPKGFNSNDKLNELDMRLKSLQDTFHSITDQSLFTQSRKNKCLIRKNDSLETQFKVCTFLSLLKQPNLIFYDDDII